MLASSLWVKLAWIQTPQSSAQACFVETGAPIAHWNAVSRRLTAYDGALMSTNSHQRRF
jgi:hypothetical protein